MDDDGMRYGLITHALIASTIATAPTIVTIQSTTMRTRRGSRPVTRSSGWWNSCSSGSGLVAPDSARSPGFVRTASREPRLRTAARAGAARLGGIGPVRRKPRRRLAARSSHAPHALASPVVDAAVVARQEDLRNAPAAEVGGSCVVRILEASVRAPRRSSRARPSPPLSAPGSRRAIASTTCHGRDLAPREDVRADRDDVGAEVVEDPLVEALEAGGQERERRLAARAPRRAPGRAVAPVGSARRPGARALPRTPTSSAAATTSTRNTIPRPPPYGSSSTCPAVSGVVSR